MQKLIHADSVMEAMPVRPTGTSPGMSYLVPCTSSLQSTERLSQSEMRSDSSELQRQRYASFSCVYHLVSTKYGPPATVHVLRRSTSSTMIHFFTYSISIDRPSLTEMRTMVSVLQEGGDGNVNNGGINSHTFARDGESSYSGQHPT